MKLWDAPGYPRKFSFKGFEFELRGQSRWARSFRTNSEKTFGKNLLLSRFLDGSANPDDAKKRLLADDLSPWAAETGQSMNREGSELVQATNRPTNRSVGSVRLF